MASEYVTRAELNALISELALHVAIEELREEMREGIKHMDKRFTDLHQQIVKVRTDLVAAEARILRALGDTRQQ